ncbi:MAG TPA: hypothetical protein VFQ39_20510, partial [Longimicrobium sp.]|nr:hypothetical protein [Longimicrobium sp.]
MCNPDIPTESDSGSAVAQAAKPQRLEYLEKLEALIAAAGEFAEEAGRTLVDLSFRPGRVLASDPGPERRHLPPKTFLALATFVSTSAVRAVIIVALLAMSSLEACFNSPGSLQPAEPLTLGLFVRVPDVTELFFVTLPTLALTLLL